MDEVEIAPDDFRESLSGVLSGVTLQQIQVGIADTQKELTT